MNTRHLERLRRRWLAIGVVVAIMLASVMPALAGTRRSGDSVVIGPDQVVTDDLYIAAETVTIDGTIKGDLLVAARLLTINGTVDGDVMAVAQDIVVNGALRDDARLAASAIQFGPSAQVADDVMVGGASIEQRPGGTIGGDVYMAGSQALLAGTTRGELQGAFGGLELRGTIDRDVNVVVGDDTSNFVIMPVTPSGAVVVPSIHTGLTVADSARIGGKLSYTAAQSGNVSQAAQIANGVAHSLVTSAPAAQPQPYAWLIDLLRRYVTLLAIGALALWLLPGWLNGLSGTVRTRPLASLGWGALGLIGTVALLLLIPFVAVLIMVLFGWLTLGGLVAITFTLATALVSTLLMVFAVLVSYIVQIIVGVLVGRWLLGLIDPRWAEGRFGPLALGLALYVLVRAVPVLGVLVALAVTLVGLGAIGQWARLRLRGGTARPGPVAPLAA